MDKKTLEDALRGYIATIKADFYAGGDFKLFGMYTVVPTVRVEDDYGNNATLTTFDGGTAGVEVTEGLLTFCDDDVIRLGACHELGHAFSERVLTNIGLAGASGAVTEVIADLGAAYLLNRSGRTWTQVREAALKGEAQHIFDPGWKGDHPPAKKRVETIDSLAHLMESGFSFADAAKGICLSCQGMKA
ncbi:MAG: hypothetical protein ACFCVH_07065 [Alphaproteobacteria bacterium]